MSKRSSRQQMISTMLSQQSEVVFHDICRHLTLNLPDHLCRSVDLGVAIEGLGKHWSSSDGTAMDYLLSRHADGPIDEFISHSWATPRYMKFAALCWLNNFEPAMKTTTVIAIVLSILQATVVPDGSPFHSSFHAGGTERAHYSCWMACTCICPCVFLFLCVYWQTLRRLFRLPQKQIFMDKLCIHQTNDQLKAMGILGLGGFLKVSKRLVVLWSTQYFSSLWCTYELAAWFQLQKDLEAIDFVPVRCAFGFVLWSLLVCVYNTLYVVVWYGLDDTALERKWIMFFIFSLIVLLVTNSARDATREVTLLGKQLQAFDIQRTRSTCCTNEHLCPRTGRTIPCDRELIYESITVWYSNASDGSGGNAKNSTYDEDDLDKQEALALEGFNVQVRTQLKQAVGLMAANMLGSLGYRNVVLIFIPRLWVVLDELPAMWAVDPTMALQYAALNISATLFWVPASSILAWQVFMLCPKDTADTSWLEAKEHIITFSVAAFLWLVFSVPFYIGTYMILNDFSVLVQGAWYLLSVLITFLAFRLWRPRTEDIMHRLSDTGCHTTFSEFGPSSSQMPEGKSQSADSLAADDIFIKPVVSQMVEARSMDINALPTVKSTATSSVTFDSTVSVVQILPCKSDFRACATLPPITEQLKSGGGRESYYDCETCGIVEEDEPVPVSREHAGLRVHSLNSRPISCTLPCSGDTGGSA
eukprot:TRINITY_DN5217_c2_g1_i1.p1 TRINITY_DN5217_c2_g1~~TRINITY_DN5217_c2_g1_i1.p1  ORF type:complete len:742 (+),score=95.33 TRINITY_DN5217_c2_g1_i1:125-2227(+)